MKRIVDVSNAKKDGLSLDEKPLRPERICELDFGITSDSETHGEHQATRTSDGIAEFSSG